MIFSDVQFSIQDSFSFDNQMYFQGWKLSLPACQRRVIQRNGEYRTLNATLLPSNCKSDKHYLLNQPIRSLSTTQWARPPNCQRDHAHPREHEPDICRDWGCEHCECHQSIRPYVSTICQTPPPTPPGYLSQQLKAIQFHGSLSVRQHHLQKMF